MLWIRYKLRTVRLLNVCFVFLCSNGFIALHILHSVYPDILLVAWFEKLKEQNNKCHHSFVKSANNTMHSQQTTLTDEFMTGWL